MDQTETFVAEDDSTETVTNSSHKRSLAEISSSSVVDHCVQLLQKTREMVCLPPVPFLDVYVRELLEMGGLKQGSIKQLVEENKKKTIDMQAYFTTLGKLSRLYNLHRRNSHV